MITTGDSETDFCDYLLFGAKYRQSSFKYLEEKQYRSKIQ